MGARIGSKVFTDIVFRGQPTGMAIMKDRVTKDARVVSCTSQGGLSRATKSRRFAHIASLSDMDLLARPVLCAFLNGASVLLGLDLRTKSVQEIASGFTSAQALASGVIELVMVGGLTGYRDVMGQPVAAPASPLPPPAPPTSAVLPSTPVALPAISAPLCPPSVAPAAVTPRTALVLPPALANKCDASGAPCVPTFVLIPAGNIKRVIDPSDQRRTIDDKFTRPGPAFARFFISQTVISNAMFEEYCRSLGQGGAPFLSNRRVPVRLAGPRQPAVMVTRSVAEGYATWLSYTLRAAGVKADVYLPERLRWEYVARAGRYGPAMTHVTSTGNHLPTPPSVQPLVHWNATDPVDVDDTTFDPIVHGGSELYHLGGNVWEWTTDTNDNGCGMVCGGAWNSRREQELRIDYADLVNPAGLNPFIGFRVYVET